MRQFIYDIWGSFVVRIQLFLKLLFGVATMFFVCFFIFKRPLYQLMYGTPTSEQLSIWNEDIFADIPDQPISQLHVNGYDIEIQAVKRFETTARVTYIDRYTKFGTWYRSHEGAALYDAIVPQDISLATGKTGHNYQCFKFSHEYRMGGGFSKYKCGHNWRKDFPTFENDISNNHSIAATPNIQRGIDILKAGDIAHIEGYLMYWNGTGKLRYQRFESAIYPGQVSKYIVEGTHPKLCRQLLITKLTFDGYTFE